MSVVLHLLFFIFLFSASAQAHHKPRPMFSEEQSIANRPHTPEAIPDTRLFETSPGGYQVGYRRTCFKEASCDDQNEFRILTPTGAFYCYNCTAHFSSNIPVYSQNAVFQSQRQLTLLLVHSTSFYDKASRTQKGAQQIVNFTREQNGETFFLYDDAEPNDQLVSFTQADHVISSTHGFHQLLISSPYLVMAGGYYEDCLGRAFYRVLNLISRSSSHAPKKIFFPMEAIFNYKRITLMEAWQQNKSPELFIPEGLKSMENLRDHLSFFNMKDINFKPFTLEFRLPGGSVYKFGDGPQRIEIVIAPVAEVESELAELLKH